ncbi:hypothetical protein [Dyadobacter sp. 676]|uniref:Uncharacterized protein n=1 Tax=Dyadobacter sp. 676 TaxID=3088362 RepID=A0AAU8FUW5_9BACT
MDWNWLLTNWFVLLSKKAFIPSDDQIEFFLFPVTTQCGFTPFQMLKNIWITFSKANKARVNQPKMTAKNDELTKKLNKWPEHRNKEGDRIMVLF